MTPTFETNAFKFGLRPYFYPQYITDSEGDRLDHYKVEVVLWDNGAVVHLIPSLSIDSYNSYHGLNIEYMFTHSIFDFIRGGNVLSHGYTHFYDNKGQILYSSGLPCLVALPEHKLLCDLYDDLILSVIPEDDLNFALSAVYHLLYPNYNVDTGHHGSFAVFQITFNILTALLYSPKTNFEYEAFLVPLSFSAQNTFHSENWDMLFGTDYINSHWDGTISLRNSLNVVNGLRKFFLGVDYAKI